MNISMSRIFLMLLIFAFIFFCQVYGDEDSWKNGGNAGSRWQSCRYEPMFFNQMITIAYFSKNRIDMFHWLNNIKTSPPTDRHPRAPHLLSICLCRNSSEPLFFMMPYGNSSDDDMIVVCIIGDEGFSSIGVLDEEELYDLLMVKYQELIPAFVIDLIPFSTNKSRCYDLDHFPTKDVMGQKTCLFSAFAANDPMSENYLYSGPLMSSPLLNQNANGILKYCYSTVENSTHNKDDICFFDHSFSKSSFACCCTKNPESCSISQKLENHYYCFAGFLFNKNFVSHDSQSFSAERYFNDYYKPACTATISALYFEYPRAHDIDYFLAVDVSYGAADSCQNNDSLYISPSEIFCSENETSTKKTTFSMTKCCDVKNLCNFDLIPLEWSKKDYDFDIDENEQNEPPLFVLLNLTRGFYNELNEKDGKWEPGRKMKLYEKFNAKFIHESKRSTPEINYVIAQIIRSDSDECEFQIIKPQDVLNYFPLYTCVPKKDCIPSFDLECPKKECIPSFDFECQQSNNQTLKSLMTWFCYVKIIPKQKDEFVIEAGFLEIKEDSPCYTQNIFNNTYCCVNVFDQNQVDTKCTMESLTLAYQKRLQVQKNASHELPDSEKTFTECLQRDIGPEQKCPGNDGCFEIRSLTESDESQVVEPAGCLGLAEDYALDKLDMTNLALGCRADLNSNRCSMVQSPSGEERIVCCCNHPDENGQCKTKADELPQTGGKAISSFKTLKS